MIYDKIILVRASLANVSNMRVILLLLPIVQCRITINILASTSSKETKVEATGSNSDIISNIERGTFRITNKDLKDAVTKFSGSRPSNVYVKSPTPWNDLYKTYNWNEITRILEPITAKIISVTSENVIVSKQEFVNNSTITATFRVGTLQITDTFTNIWTKNGNLTVKEDISYSISFVERIGGAKNVIYHNLWGEDRRERQRIVIGASAAVDVMLQPEQRVTALLIANQGSIDVEIDYTANLEGDVVCNYPRLYEGHYFWAYNINGVLKAAALPMEVISKEVITVKFYTDARLIVIDKYNVKLIDVPVDILR